MPENVACLLIHNGFISFKRQIKGIADPLGFPTQELVIKPKKILHYIPLSLQLLYYIFYFKKNFASSEPLILIGTGRLIIPAILAIKFLKKSKAFAIFVQKPCFGASFFDLIIAPEHDQIQGPRVLQSLGAINDFTVESFEKLSPSAETLKNRIHSSPLIGMILGGKTKAYEFNSSQVETFIKEIENITTKTEGTFVILSSRRSGPFLESLLKEKFKESQRVLIYTSEDTYNPYPDLLRMADYFMITEDSVNLISETCFTGKPVYLLSLPEYHHGQRKLRFINAMIKSNKARYYQSSLDHYSYEPLQEAQRLTPEIQSRLSLWLSNLK